MAPSDRLQQIEALLFALGRPLTRAELTIHLGCTGEEIDEALRIPREGRGVVIVDDGGEIELRVAGSAAALIERVRKEEYARDIGKAGEEVLAAILYRGPLTRSEIDFIRGVNSSQTLRTLTLRGLVRKAQNPKDPRSFLYEPTTELLAQLGVESNKDLPDYTEIRAKLQALEDAYRQKQED